VEQVKVPNGQ
jgi:hypothetical protein